MACDRVTAPDLGQWPVGYIRSRHNPGQADLGAIPQKVERGDPVDPGP